MYMRDIIFDKKRNVVRLNREESVEKITRLMKRLGAPATSALSIFLVAVLVLGYQSFVAKADVAYFYPSRCLGDWQNSEFAAGGRDTGEDAGSDEFDDENSAVLTQSSGRIYCGQFQGSLPDKAIPTDIRVGVAFTYKERIVEVEVNAEAVTEEGELDPEFTATSTASSTAEIIPEVSPEVTAEIEPEVLGETVEVETETETETVVDTEIDVETESELVEPEVIPEPEVVPSPESEPTTWLFLGANIAYAQEEVVETVTEELIVDEVPVTTSTLEVATEIPEEIKENTEIIEIVEAVDPVEKATTTEEVEVVLVEEETKDVLPEVLGEATTTPTIPTATTTLATTTEEIVVTGEIAVSEGPHDIVEILYTLDGENWVSIGLLNSSDTSDAILQIPIVDVSDLSRMQISVQAVGATDEMPDVYIDSIWAEVTFEEKEKEQKIHQPPVRIAYASTGFWPLPVYESENEMFTPNTEDQVRCVVEPFSQESAGGEILTYRLKLHTQEMFRPFRVTLGDLPTGTGGISLDYDELSMARELKLMVDVSGEATPGSFGSVILYEEIYEDGMVNRNICQFNLIVKER